MTGPDPNAMARIDFLVDGYRAALMRAHGLVGRMECDGPDAAENLPPHGVGGGSPAGVSVPPELPPAGHPQLSTAAIESGHDMGVGFAAEMFPQHTKHRR